MKPPIQTIPVLLLIGVLVGCQSAHRFEFVEPHMGTEFRLVFYAPDGASAHRAQRRAFERIQQLEQILSDYREDSELRTLCRNGVAGNADAWPVSVDLMAVLLAADEIAVRTDGAFDVTVGPLVRLWRRAARQHEWPAPTRLDAARRSVGYGHLVLDPERATVAFRRPGMQLDVGGIGKGFTADAALRSLREDGIDRALVDAGGDVSVASPPPGEAGWKVAVDPGPGVGPLVLLLRDAAVATSGDRYQFVEVDGVRYSHVLDPRTGVGSNGRFSATVIASDGATADALASALCVLGPDGLPMIDAWSSVEARVTAGDSDSRVTVESKGFESWVLASEVRPAR